MGNRLRRIIETESDSVVTRDVVAAWIFLFVFVVVAAIVLWPDGLIGWRIGAVAAGALVGAIAASRRLRFRESLWSLSGFLMGGLLIVVVFQNDFGTRHGLGVVLLIALLIFDIAEASPHGLAKRRERSTAP